MLDAAATDWKHYIGGRWVGGSDDKHKGIEDPATDEAFAYMALATAADVDKAVEAARRCVAARYIREKGQEAILNYVQSNNVGIRLKDPGHGLIV